MTSLSQKVQEFRKAKGWNTTEMAKFVGTSRQNIENLEANTVGQPRYISKLAEVMGTTVDELLGTRSAITTQAVGTLTKADGVVVSPALGVEAIANALVLMTDEQREAMAGKLASLARAPDSPTLKKSISESLGSPPLPPVPKT